ncbi:MAG: SUMF1/EgtB/PvdO family nonheme iron enzyme [Limimaricola sp.]|nr:SUMF1/EgtB/PvdO family nonheme iron enzyme [Limimaricola sp.]
MDAVRDIFAGNPIIGQGNPAVTRHPMTPAECAARIPGGPASYSNPRFERICGGPYMAPLYDPDTQRPEDATSCIDMFEFPDIPCTYPVVWVKAREAAEICAAEGKRICDAHEWEGACQGELDPPDYTFGVSVEAQRAIHNSRDAATARWSYGPAYQRGVCAADSSKTPGCNGGSFAGCGSNTYPTGSFPDCHSPLGVYDLNGNAAEHMNLPLAPSQMASAGSTTLGVTEMKGSWFIFDKFRAHPDWCRWRAPFWHGTQVMSTASHENYHLGFRCCKTLG